MLRKSVAPEEARELILQIRSPEPSSERVPLTAAYGRVLAEDVTAELPIPPFDRSPFDGYAFRGEDTAAASENHPVTLRITEEIPAGSVPAIDITPGYAAKILTGAPMPRGADSTIKYELTEFTAETVTFKKPVPPGSDVVYAGDDVAAGSLAARRGDVISPATVGLFASLGKTEIPVFRRPRAAVLNTGSELVEPGEPLPYGKIYNSSVFTLIGALAELGVEGYNAGVARDDPAEIAAAIEKNLPLCDVIITTGGASVGDYDFSLASAEKLGAETLFWKTKLKPGGAMLASRVGDKLLLSLSGNPGSALMALLHIASPFLRRLAGRRDISPEPVFARLGEPYNRAASPRTRLLRGRLDISADGTAYFIEYDEQGGGALSSFAGCDLLGEIPPGSPPLPAGTLIRAWRI
ncbi:MAG: molybdopterin molybdotransferase MoeA [Oscillospiraceae bacterium]|jgi:molybdopterin molybdotransferase|nr:molybdopterin molybdotransferase MoeA [Oscillospiraceae bacterium]